MTLGALKGLVVLDEIQLRPDLFPVLRVLSDRSDTHTHFLILGSASPDLIRESSETLAGRVEFVDLHGFDLLETGAGDWRQLWIRGGFPRSFLAGNEEDSVAWREGFIRTFLERDLPQLGIRTAAPLMRRFWSMLAHVHGHVWNASALGRGLGMTDKTVKGYLDDLTRTYMIRQLPPWFENLNKRQIKAPKIYLRDSGILHRLLELDSERVLAGHPVVGFSWEGFALEQILRITGIQNAYYWATQGGAELDLLTFVGGKRIGYEFKFNENPTKTRSMHSAIHDLKLDTLRIVIPGSVYTKLDDRIEVWGLEQLQHARGKRRIE